MTFNFYQNKSWIELLFMDKEDRKRHYFFKKVYNSILDDLKEIKRNDECNAVPEVGERYYNIVIKGANTDIWRAYFLKEDNPAVAFPCPNGSIMIQDLAGGSIYHYNGMEPSKRSYFWIPSYGFNYENIWNVEMKLKDQQFVYDWLMTNTNYKMYSNSFPSWDSKSYCKITKK